MGKKGLKEMTIEERFEIAKRDFDKWKSIKAKRDKRALELIGAYYYNQIKGTENQILVISEIIKSIKNKDDISALESLMKSENVESAKTDIEELPEVEIKEEPEMEIPVEQKPKKRTYRKKVKALPEA